ncbi:MAG: deoxyribonuclease IV [Chloroflexi bacterium]|nr:deoxyribonuclease IV [Chloroflexota bacterium]
MKIGAHVSTAGGLDKAPARALDIGAEAIQIFGSSPQMWRYSPPSDAQVASFREQMEAGGIGPAFLHGIYLINLAQEEGDNLARSIESLVAHMTLASRIGSPGVIFHLGSHKGQGFDAVLSRVTAAMRYVLESTPPDTSLIIENNAGRGQQVGATWGEIGRIIREVGQRVDVCFDTCHALVAGYDVTSRQGLETAMDEFDREIGLQHLVAVHANDSKGKLGSGLDRHENIGQGFIGLAGFANILSHPTFANVPFLLEVPGLDNKGPDKPNVDALRAIRDGLRQVS